MKPLHRSVWVLMLLVSISAMGMADRGATDEASVAGIVVDESGPVAGAVVRVQTTDRATRTDVEGRFSLAARSDDGALLLIAFAPGYVIVGPIEARPGERDVRFELHRHNLTDHPEYAWISAYDQPDVEGNCAECHSAPAEEGLFLPFDEWVVDAHGNAAVNPRFLSMYNGTDRSGERKSPETRYTYHKDYGRIPLPPDPNEPYYGPGYKLDFPDTAGNCAACHLPAAAIDDPYGTDPNQAEGVGREGVACDFCHKVWDVRVDADTRLPVANMPGVLSMDVLRPPEGHQLFIGPFDDVAPGEDTYSPLQDESRYCAACHFGQFWGVTVYNSYGEWLSSPYAVPETGQTCQDCHMPRRGATRFALPEQGGLERDPERIFSHRMPGALEEQLLRNAVSLDVRAMRQGKQLLVDVTVANDQTGHHVPTDSPLRNLILLVEATDSSGEMLEQLRGPQVPSWGGEGDPADGNYAGLPGKGYAKVLEQLWTEISPTGAYWTQTRVLSDNRLSAFTSETTRYVFALPDDVEAEVHVRLWFRRAFKALMDQKGWRTPDILMEEARVSVR